MLATIKCLYCWFVEENVPRATIFEFLSCFLEKKRPSQRRMAGVERKTRAESRERKRAGNHERYWNKQRRSVLEEWEGPIQREYVCVCVCICLGGAYKLEVQPHECLCSS